MVLIVANHGNVMPNQLLSRCEAPHSHIVVAPGATAFVVISRSEKYAAKSAAKNISSLASQMITPDGEVVGTAPAALQPTGGDRVQRAGTAPAGALSGVVWAIAPLWPTQRPMVTTEDR